jgi:hypothetical protein
VSKFQESLRGLIERIVMQNQSRNSPGQVWLLETFTDVWVDGLLYLTNMNCLSRRAKWTQIWQWGDLILKISYSCHFFPQNLCQILKVNFSLYRSWRNKDERWVYLSLHSFLTSVLDESEWLISRSHPFTQGVDPVVYRMNRKWGGLRSRSGLYGEEKNPSPLMSLCPRHYSDWATQVNVKYLSYFGKLLVYLWFI